MQKFSVIVGALILVLSTAASAAAPASIPIQGFITDQTGSPIDGPQTMTFALFPSAEGGTFLYSEQQIVLVQDGFFSAYVGEGQSADGVPLDLGLFRDLASQPDREGTLFFELMVGEETLSPRQTIGTTPFAAYAQFAGTAQRLENGFLSPSLSTCRMGCRTETMIPHTKAARG